MYLEDIKSKLAKKSTNLTTGDALCNPWYRRATWICIIYMFYHEAAGINVLLMYSSTIFENMEGSGGMSPRAGSVLIGGCKIIFALFAIQTAKYLPRRTMLIVGHTTIAATWFVMAVFNHFHMDSGVLAMMLLFLFIY